MSFEEPQFYLYFYYYLRSFVGFPMQGKRLLGLLEYWQFSHVSLNNLLDSWISVMWRLKKWVFLHQVVMPCPPPSTTQLEWCLFQLPAWPILHYFAEKDADFWRTNILFCFKTTQAASVFLKCRWEVSLDLWHIFKPFFAQIYLWHIWMKICID